MAGNVPNFKRKKPTDSRGCVNPKLGKSEKILSNIHHSHTLMHKKILKSEGDREVSPCLQGETIHMTDFLLVNHGGHKEGAYEIFRMWEERNCQPRI